MPRLLAGDPASGTTDLSGLLCILCTSNLLYSPLPVEAEAKASTSAVYQNSRILRSRPGLASFPRGLDTLRSPPSLLLTPPKAKLEKVF